MNFKKESKFFLALLNIDTSFNVEDDATKSEMMTAHKVTAMKRRLPDLQSQTLEFQKLDQPMLQVLWLQPHPKVMQIHHIQMPQMQRRPRLQKLLSL